jgi:uncharacterized membrane protein YcaP (DUF421 family)
MKTDKQKLIEHKVEDVSKIRVARLERSGDISFIKWEGTA